MAPLPPRVKLRTRTLSARAVHAPRHLTADSIKNSNPAIQRFIVLDFPHENLFYVPVRRGYKQKLQMTGSPLRKAFKIVYEI